MRTPVVRIALLACAARGFQLRPPPQTLPTARPAASIDARPGRPRPRDRAAANAAALALGAGAGAALVLANDAQAIGALLTSADAGGVAPLPYAAELLARLPADWLAWYDAAALSTPVFTKACTSGVCYFVGDLVAQAVVPPPRPEGPSGSDEGASLEAWLERVDLARAARSSAAGFIGHGPVAHWWLGFVDAHLSFGGAWWAVVPKIVVDQGPMSIVYNTIYTTLIGAFELRAPSAVLRDVRTTWWPSMRSSLCFWPPVHLVTFSTLIPPELKLLWVDAMEIVWIAILSAVNERERVATGGATDGAPASEAPRMKQVPSAVPV
jgi:protein Mpv17